MLYVVQGALRGERPRDVIRRSTIIAVIAFLTLIDLFGSQALLPMLVEAFAVEPALMGFAVNASTLGMAFASLVVAWFADRIDRKRGIWLSLALLSIPTMLLGFVDNVWLFMALRVLQGVCMATAFTLTMTYLAEQCDVMAAGGAMAAYITGNVASNLLGRIAAVSAADLTGLSGSFFTFAVFNLVGAALAYMIIGPRDEAPPGRSGKPLLAWQRLLGNPMVGATFLIGFIILFVFVGMFTYVNLYLVDVLEVPASALGLVYLVFIPAMVTTPMAAGFVSRHDARPTLIAALALALAAALATLLPVLWVVLVALAVFGSATFFAQAAATGFLARMVKRDRAAASGLYLTSYYLGGLFGSLALGLAGAAQSWSSAVVWIGAALLAAIGLALLLGARRQEGPVAEPHQLAGRTLGGDPSRGQG